MTIASDCMSEFTKQNLETIGLVEQVQCVKKKSLKASFFWDDQADALTPLF
jgi:hypothetical protein